MSNNKPSKTDMGTTKNGKATFPDLKTEFERPSPPPPSPQTPGDRIGFAVVGLGRLTLGQILPAFAECKHAKLVALVSGTPDKAEAVAKQYGIRGDAIYSYKNFDDIKYNPEIQAVYIVLPNNMHREFTERAAAVGKHVLCEKPLASTTKDAAAMVAACDKAAVKLMTAYRCQYEPYNRHVIALARDAELGEIRFIEANNSQSQDAPDQWRLKKEAAGGGALPDIGLYCLNIARAITGEEPDHVFAYLSQPKDDPRFREVEAGMSFMLHFPSGVIANCNTSYDAYSSKDLCVRLEQGWIKLNDAFAYQGKQLQVARRQGDTASITEIHIGEQNQFALEIDHMAECIQQDKMPRTPGEEGLQDHIVMDALYESARTGKAVALKTPSKKDATRGPKLKEAA